MTKGLGWMLNGKQKGWKASADWPVITFVIGSMSGPARAAFSPTLQLYASSFFSPQTTQQAGCTNLFIGKPTNN